MCRIVVGSLAVLSLFGPLTAFCQSYDDTVPASDWRVAGGLQAACPNQDYPVSGWQGET